MRFFFTVILLTICLVSTQTFAQNILIDENFSDWDSVTTYAEDPAGDNNQSEIDILKLAVTNDNNYIYFYIKAGEEFQFQDFNNVTLYIDSDNDAATGLQVAPQNIGADFTFTFGQRNGMYYGGTDVQVYQNAAGLVSAPTVTSAEFEFKFDLDAQVSGYTVFPSDTITIYLSEEDGDSAPVEPLTYALIENDSDYPDYFISKKDTSHIRFMSYNVLRDNLFEENPKENFRRIFQAVQPDIIGLQEIYEHTAQETADIIEEFLPTDRNETWYYAGAGNDNFVVSKYPVINSMSVSGNSAFLLELEDRNLLFIVMHPPCCSNNDGRQNEFDDMMAFVRDSQNGGGFDIEPETPIVILGDMNLVGLAQQQTTLLTGDILNEGFYGSDFNPDWDGTALEDASPYTTGVPASFTWYSEGSSFSPGRLDYIVYSGSVMEMQNSFALFTPALETDTLSKYGLEADDTKIASDHLPLAADFVLTPKTGIEHETVMADKFYLKQNYPNPFNAGTVINYSINKNTHVNLTVYNALGEKVWTVVNKRQSAGKYSISFNWPDLPSGVYIYRLTTEDYSETKKMLLLK